MSISFLEVFLRYVSSVFSRFWAAFEISNESQGPLCAAVVAPLSPRMSQPLSSDASRLCASVSRSMHWRKHNSDELAGERLSGEDINASR